MIKSIFPIAIFIIISAQVLFGQEVMTLERAIAIALDNNFDIKISEKNIEIAENNNSWARVGRGPTVDLSGGLNNNLVNDNNPASFLQGTYYAGSLSASANANWVLFNGGRIKLAKEQLGVLVDQQKLNQNIAIHDLLRTVIQQYNTILFENDRMSALQNNFALSKDKLSFEQTRREFGVSNSFNMIQFENAILVDSSTVVSQNQNIEIAKRNLFTTLNLPSSSDYRFSDALSTKPEEIELEALKSSLSEENYTIKTLEVIAALNELNTELERANGKPVITASGGLTFARNAFKFFADDPNTGEQFPLLWSNRISGDLGVNATWNLYDGGVRKANVQNAKLQNEIDQLGVLEAVAALNNQLEILVSNYQNQLDLLAISENQIRITERNLEMTEERFKAGQITSLDYRNVQTQLLDAEYQLTANLYNLIITKSEIDYLVGRFQNLN